MPVFACVSSQRPNDVQVVVSGELDLATVGRLDEVLEGLSRPGVEVVIDLRRLDFVDLSGARLLVYWHRRIRRLSGRMTVLGATELVNGPLALAGLDDELDVVVRARPKARDTARPGGAEQVVDALRRMSWQAAQARQKAAVERLETVTADRDELRDRVACLERELLDLLGELPAAAEPAALARAPRSLTARLDPAIR